MFVKEAKTENPWEGCQAFVVGLHINQQANQFNTMKAANL